MCLDESQEPCPSLPLQRSRRLTGGASVPPKDIKDDELFSMFEMDII